MPSLSSTSALLSSLPPQPWGTRFLDNLRLISPIAWYGLARNAAKSPFVDVHWEVLVRGLFGFLVPLLVIIVSKHLIQQSTPMARGNIVSSYLLSPWACHCFFFTMLNPFHQLRQAGMHQLAFRAEPLPEAVTVLQDAVAQSRAIRHRRYDLYLPPPVNNNSRDRKKKVKGGTMGEPKAILLIPGVGVDHASYAPVAVKLATGGYHVVIPSLEPFRLAQPFLGADWFSMRRIMRHVQRQLSTDLHWTLAGHSAGSFAAMALAYKMHAQANSATKANNLHVSSNLIMWASMYLLPYMTSLKMTNIRMLLIQGDCDALLELTMNAKSGFEEEYLPAQSRLVVIRGATHAGFASYKSTIIESGRISQEKQQQRACRETLKFLQGKDQKDSNNNNNDMTRTTTKFL